MMNYSTSPVQMLSSVLHHRKLLGSMIRREVSGRYQGSTMGMMWAFLSPALMLVVYTFVFSVVFKARWTAGSDSKTEFALVLFAGLLVFNLFSECINRAPGLIMGNANYVKRVVFPLELLPVISLGAALFHGLVSFLVWLLFYLVFFGLPPPTALLFPLVVLPMLLYALGFSWMLSSLGVYLRDLVQFIGLLTTTLMFLSPVFFPVSALPKDYQSWMKANPLTVTIEQVRDVLIWGKLPDFAELGVQFLMAALVCWLGFYWFQKTRVGFADVV